MGRVYQSIEIDNTIREMVEMEQTYTYEMTPWESGFLMGLLNKKRPHKILEIGVAEGGTSVLIKKKLELFDNLEYQMYSIDLNEVLYRDREKKTGYQFTDACQKEIINRNRHQFLLGHYLPEVIDDIGGDIDFVVLDTVHCAPGELLDLLVVLPYMKEGGIVCFHDIALDHNNISRTNAYINKMLFDVVSSKVKYFNINGYDRDRASGFPNIGAFEVEKETINRTIDLFSCFSFPWQYMPGQAELDLYQQKYIRLYFEEENKLFCRAVSLNENSMKARKTQWEETCHMLKNNEVYVYGTGTRGKKLYAYLHALGIDVCGFLVSDGHKTEDQLYDIKVMNLSEYKKKDDSVVIVGTTYRGVIQVLEESCIIYYDPTDYFMSQVYDFCETRQMLC